MTNKLNFDQLFRQNSDGSIEPLKVVKIGGVQFGPGVSFRGGVSFGGVDLSKYVGRDFLVEERNGVYIITGIY